MSPPRAVLMFALGGQYDINVGRVMRENIIYQAINNVMDGLPYGEMITQMAIDAGIEFETLDERLKPPVVLSPDYFGPKKKKKPKKNTLPERLWNQTDAAFRHDFYTAADWAYERDEDQRMGLMGIHARNEAIKEKLGVYGFYPSVSPKSYPAPNWYYDYGEIPPEVDDEIAASLEDDDEEDKPYVD